MGKYHNLSEEKNETNEIGKLCEKGEFSKLLALLNDTVDDVAREEIKLEIKNEEHGLINKMFLSLNSLFDEMEYYDKNEDGIGAGKIMIPGLFDKITTLFTLLIKLEPSLNDTLIKSVSCISKKLKNEKDSFDPSTKVLDKMPECRKAITNFIDYYNKFVEKESAKSEKIDLTLEEHWCLWNIIVLHKKTSADMDFLNGLSKDKKYFSGMKKAVPNLVTKQIFCLNLNEKKLFGNFVGTESGFLLENLKNLPEEMHSAQNFRAQILDVLKFRLTEVENEQEKSRFRYFKPMHLANKVKAYGTMIEGLKQPGSQNEHTSLISQVLKKFGCAEMILSMIGATQAKNDDLESGVSDTIKLNI